MGFLRIVECQWCKEDYATRKDDISQHRKCGKRTKNPSLVPDELKDADPYRSRPYHYY